MDIEHTHQVFSGCLMVKKLNPQMDLFFSLITEFVSVFSVISYSSFLILFRIKLVLHSKIDKNNDNESRQKGSGF